MKTILFLLFVLTACSSFYSASLSITDDDKDQKPEATLSFTIEPEKLPIIEE